MNETTHTPAQYDLGDIVEELQGMIWDHGAERGVFADAMPPADAATTDHATGWPLIITTNGGQRWELTVKPVDDSELLEAARTALVVLEGLAQIRRPGDALERLANAIAKTEGRQ